MCQGSSTFGDRANRDSLDTVGTRPSFDLQPKAKQTVSFQMLDQPAYSANLDSFVSGNGKLEHDLSSFDNDFDTTQLDNPLFGSTMGREHVHGTRGVALTRASVAAQMFQNLAEADSSLNVESRDQLAQGVRDVQHQVRLQLLSVPSVIIHGIAWYLHDASWHSDFFTTLKHLGVAASSKCGSALRRCFAVCVRLV